MKKYLISDLWLILLLATLIAVIWLNVKEVRKMNETIQAQNATISTLSDSLNRWVEMWEAPSREWGWEVPEGGGKTGGR